MPRLFFPDPKAASKARYHPQKESARFDAESRRLLLHPPPHNSAGR